MPDAEGKPVQAAQDEWIIVDELPPEDPRSSGVRTSQWEKTLDKVKAEVEPGKAVCVKTYENKNAASAAATTLRRKYGTTPAAFGFNFAVRTVKVKGAKADAPVKRGLFVQYLPKQIVPGEAEKVTAEFEAWSKDHNAKLAVTAKKRAEKAKAEKAATPA